MATNEMEAVELLDSPIGPCEPRFWMRPAPESLTLAFHRDSRGVWETVSEEFPAQERLWEVVEFTRVGSEPARPWSGRGTNWGARALYAPSDQVAAARAVCVAGGRTTQPSAVPDAPIRGAGVDPESPEIHSQFPVSNSPEATSHVN